MVKSKSIKSQISSTKLQTNSKSQYSITQTVTGIDSDSFGILNFGHWDLFEIRYLVLGI
jgi:hypothetical protein